MKLKDRVFFTEEEMIERMKNPDSVEIGLEGDAAAAAAAAGGSGGGGGGGTEAFVPSTHWDLYKSKLPETEKASFKLPENLNRDNEAEELDKYLSKVYTKQPSFDNLHPLAREIQEAAQTGQFDPETFIQSKFNSFNITNVSDDDLLFASYKQRVGKSDNNPTGFEDDQIRNELSRIDALEKRERANMIRQTESQRMREAYSVDNTKTIEQRKSAYLQEVDQNINQIFKTEAERGQEASKIRTIGGIDIGESNFQAMKDDYRKLIMFDEKGEIPLAVKLQDPNTYFKFAMFEKYEKYFADAITKARNEGKFSAIDMLPSNPIHGSGGIGNSGEPFSIEESIRRMGSPDGTK